MNFKRIEKVTDNDLLNHALHYAKLNYPILPLHSLKANKKCSCRAGANCDRIAKHPRTRNGHKDATTDEQTIKAWWEKFPTANIGLITGIKTDIFVLDIDVKDGGEYSLEYLQEDYKTLLKENYEFLPATLTTFTGSGGRHLYFKHPSDFKIQGSASSIGNGLDIRGDDNYIIAPPSQHSKGNKYRWFGINTPIETAPDWLIYEIIKSTQEKETKKSVKANYRRQKYTEKVSEGKRSDFIMQYVCGLVNSFTEDEVLKRAMKLNEDFCVPPLPEKRVESTVKWACNKFSK